MRQNGEKVDSAAPASKNAVKTCVRCNASVQATHSECPECGAPMHGLRLIENVSDTVHKDLAHANLLRMRGEYREAEDQCLSILKRYPHHLETHTLMGDIYADQDQFEQAGQWYELAIDLDPESFINRQKLQLAKDRQRARETQTTEAQLGLPNNHGLRTLLYSCLALVVIGICAFLAYDLGRQTAKPKGSGVVGGSIAATQDSLLNNEPATPNHEEAVVSNPAPSTPPAPALMAEDKAITDTLRAGNYGNRLMLATMDPRTKQLTITYRLVEGETDRKVGAEIGREALSLVPESLTVTVKGVRNDRLAYMADVPRNRMAETQTEAWQSSSTGTDAWVQYVVQNEWFAVAPQVQEPQGTGAIDPH